VTPYGAEDILRLADAQNIAFGDRGLYCADADFVDVSRACSLQLLMHLIKQVPVEGLLDKFYARERRNEFMKPFDSVSVPVPAGDIFWVF
jgi:gamma-glutamyltranspeptidase